MRTGLIVGSLLFLVPLGAIVAVLAFSGYRARRARARLALAGRGAHQQHIAEAIRVLEKARLSKARMKALHALGYAYLRAGEFEPAISVFLEIERLAPQQRQSKDFYKANVEDLALALVCAGRLEEAETTVDRLDDSWHPARLAVLIRAGDFTGAVDAELFTSASWSFQAWRHNQRVFRLLQCLARHQLGVANDGTQLNQARPSSSVEYDYLTCNWPELAAFIEEHDLEPRRRKLAGRIQLPVARVIERKQPVALLRAGTADPS